MNNCTFVGKLTRKTDLIKGDAGVYFMDFELCIEEAIKHKKIHTYVDCEIWDTGAEALNNIVQIGDNLVVDASARNTSDGVVFRVNKFKVFWGE
jgi:single-stranded DNA-binding protein